MKLNMSLGNRLIVLVCSLIVGLFIAGVLAAALPLWGITGRGATIASVVLQDVLVFIAPALLAAAFAPQGWARSLRLTVGLRWSWVAVAVAVYVLSLPAMNYLVELNKAMTLPAALSGVEQWMRHSEQMALAMTNSLIDVHSLPAMLGILLVVGALAALSEELLFRGAMLGMTLDRGVNRHVAVWLIAVVFSAIHMQFFGFFPRLLMGAWLGYLMLWSRSLWLPFIAHFLNNGMVVIVTYLANINVISSISLDQIGVPAPGSFPYLAAVSTLATAATITLALRLIKTDAAQ